MKSNSILWEEKKAGKIILDAIFTTFPIANSLIYAFNADFLQNVFRDIFYATQIKFLSFILLKEKLCKGYVSCRTKLNLNSAQSRKVTNILACLSINIYIKQCFFLYSDKAKLCIFFL